MNAWNDLEEKLQEREVVEFLTFGQWGWGGCGEDTKFIPDDLKGKVLTPAQAKPMMDGWSFNGGFGTPDCYAVNIWTNKRVIWVTQYDGSTKLNSAPRNPQEIMPDMPGVLPLPLAHA